MKSTSKTINTGLQYLKNRFKLFSLNLAGLRFECQLVYDEQKYKSSQEKGGKGNKGIPEDLVVQGLAA